jgi:hypothetical protein
VALRGATGKAAGEKHYGGEWLTWSPPRRVPLARGAMVMCGRIQAGRASYLYSSESPPNFHGPQNAIPGPERGRMYDVLSALIPPAVVGGAFVYGAFKLLRSEAASRRPAKQRDQAESQNS